MSKPTFVWSHDIGALQQITPLVTQTKFGDGYESRIANGINVTPKTWEVSFTGDRIKAQDIMAFLEARAGTESFRWIDPMNKEGIYVCRKWGGSQRAFGVYVIQTTFEQVFEA